MKLRPIIKKEQKEKIEYQGVKENTKKNTKKKDTKTTSNKKENNLPPDGYTPMFEPLRLLVREMPSQKDHTKVVKQYIELSVKRFDDDEALPFVWLNMYQESDFYTGYLKGKTVHLPLDVAYDLIEGLSELIEECDKRNITT